VSLLEHLTAREFCGVSDTYQPPAAAALLAPGSPALAPVLPPSEQPQPGPAKTADVIFYAIEAVFPNIPGCLLEIPSVATSVLTFITVS
jgi:hypothetical protein